MTEKQKKFTFSEEELKAYTEGIANKTKEMLGIGEEEVFNAEDTERFANTTLSNLLGIKSEEKK